jgi:Kef-type K+ transport system membrane component KefB
VVTSVAGIGLPVILGGSLGVLMVTKGGGHLFPAGGVTQWQAGLFIAAAISITAFPMLAWIIYDTGLLNTRIGTVALACAAADDAAAWVLLATVVAMTHHSPADVAEALIGGVAFVCSCWSWASVCWPDSGRARTGGSPRTGRFPPVRSS